MMKKKKSVLIVAAHPDDEVLGCGGTIAKLSSSGSKINILFLSNGEDSRKTSKSEMKKKILKRKNAAKLASKILGSNKPNFADLSDNQLDSYPLIKIIKIIEKNIKKYKPSIIYTHFKNDLNIDHQIANRAVTTACRPQKNSSVKSLFFFEVPSSTEWRIDTKNKIFNPNWFEDITKTKNKKLLALKAYKSELRKWPHPRSFKGIEYLARLRGAQVGCDFAESFYLAREVNFE